jgi:hypothetical protein
MISSTNEWLLTHTMVWHALCNPNLTYLKLHWDCLVLVVPLTEMIVSMADLSQCKYYVANGFMLYSLNLVMVMVMLGVVTNKIQVLLYHASALVRGCYWSDPLIHSSTK